MNVIAVIQARMGSARLPGKVLSDLGGRPVLEWVIRAARASNVDDVIVATSVHGDDQAIVDLCRKLGVRVVCGDEQDVLSRYIVALEAGGADAVVRLTSDCPLLDPELINQVVAVWRCNPTLDYVSTTLNRTLPRGLDVELAAAGALRQADARAVGYHRVHVTSSLYELDAPYACAGLMFRPAYNQFRVTLDEEADAIALAQLVEILGDQPPAWRDVVNALVRHPEIVAINAGVEQKTLIEG
ncbi:spore coat protein [Cryobacterium flavum]|nr:spore coat protein [Cryobacterium flavum]